MTRAHQHRPMAESFGVDAERYDRSRPTYPAGLLERIVAALPGPEVVDVGCGTGILARQLQSAGCRVLGVEPDARMAAFARASGVAVEEARFEDWDAAGRTFDAVVAGTAWHWVDPVAGAAKAAQVLRPGGLLVLLWNVGEPPAEVSTALADAFLDVVPNPPFDPRAARSGAGAYRAALDDWADGVRSTGAFQDPLQDQLQWTQPYTRDEWLDQLPTTGALTMLGRSAQATILNRVGAAVDALGGSVSVRWTCLALLATLA